MNVGIIDKLFDRAYAEPKRYYRRGVEVYRIARNENEVSLYHYRQKTLTTDGRILTYLYGISLSDVNSINTILNRLGLDRLVCVGYKPVNGGFYARLCLLDKELFLTDYARPEDFAEEVSSLMMSSVTYGKNTVRLHQNSMPVL